MVYKSNPRDDDRKDRTKLTYPKLNLITKKFNKVTDLTGIAGVLSETLSKVIPGSKTLVFFYDESEKISSSYSLDEKSKIIKIDQKKYPNQKFFLNLKQATTLDHNKIKFYQTVESSKYNAVIPILAGDQKYGLAVLNSPISISQNQLKNFDIIAFEVGSAIERLGLREIINTIIQDNPNYGIIIINKNYNIVEINDTLKEYFQINSRTNFINISSLLRRVSDNRSISLDYSYRKILTKLKNKEEFTFYAQIKLIHAETARHIQIAVRPILSPNLYGYTIITAHDVSSLIEKTVEANTMMEEARTRLRHLSTLFELNEIGGFNITKIHNQYITKTSSLLGSPSVSIYNYDPRKQKLIRGATTINFNEHPRQLGLYSNNLIARSFVIKQPLDCRMSSRRNVNISSNCNMIVVPIVSGTKVWGVIVVGGRLQPYTSYDLELLKSVATRLAIIIENTNLYYDVNSRRERWEAVFRFTEEGIVIFNDKKAIVGFNPAAATLTGYKLSDSINQPISKIINIQTNEKAKITTLDPVDTVLNDGKTVSKSQNLIKTKTGKKRWVEISYSPIFNNDNKVISGIAIVHDTEKDKQLEESKKDFISIVSHELRTPLSAVKGFLSMILDYDFGKLNDRQYHYLGRVYQSNQRMIDLVEDLLDSSRIEDGRVSLNLRPIMLEGIVNEVVADLTPKGLEHQINLRINRKKRLPLVLADEPRLRQIFVNLIDNYSIIKL